MSTIDDPRPLTRKELASFLPNMRAVRAFEKLFEIIPPDINDLNTYLDAVRTQSINVTADHDAGIGNFLILVDATTGPVTVTLPAVAAAFISYNDVVSYITIGITKIDASANAVTIVGQAGETVVGEVSQDLLLAGEVINVVPDVDSTNDWELAS